MNEEQEQQNQIAEAAKQQAKQQIKQQGSQAIKNAAKETSKKLAQLIAKNPYVRIAIVVIVVILLIIILLAGAKMLLDQETVAQAAELMSGDLSDYITINGDHFEIDESLYEEFINKLEKQGITGGQYLSKDSKYLKAIIKAELATTYPKLKNEDTNLSNNSFQGAVQIIRRSYEAADEDKYYDGGEGDDKELLLEYMDPDQFDDEIKKLKSKDEFDEEAYNKLRRYYTIGGESGSSGGSSGDGGSDATGSYNGQEIKYDATFAALEKTPEELGLTVANEFSGVRTTVYCACSYENGGYAGQTSTGIDLEAGRHLIAILGSEFGLEYGDWVYIEGKGYYQVCDIGQGFENRMDVFYGKEGDDLGIGQSSCPQESDMANRQSEIGDYNNVKIIKKSVADTFIASGYVRDESTNGTTNSQSSSNNNASSIKIKIPTYNGTSIGVSEITYQNNVSKYSVPVEFLISQLEVTQNPEYIYSLADMIVNNSKIELVIQETYSYSYTHTVVNEEQTYTETTGKDDRPITKTKIVTVSDTESESETIGIMKYIREVDTWIVNVTQEFIKKDTRYQESGGVSYNEVGTFTYTKKGQVTYGDIPVVSDESADSLADSATKGIAQDIPDSIKQTMQGKSMVDNSNIGYNDLSYLTIPYKDFSGNRKVGHMVVAKDLADEVLSIFEELYNIGYPIEKMELVDNYYEGTRTSGSTDLNSDSSSIDDNNTSAFNYRSSTSGGGLSKHALGRAIDINPKINPYVKADGTGVHQNAAKFWNRSESNRATWSDVEQKAYIGPGTEIYNIFVNKGWTWGGSWSTYRDYQHFEKP